MIGPPASAYSTPVCLAKNDRPRITPATATSRWPRKPASARAHRDRPISPPVAMNKNIVSARTRSYQPSMNGYAAANRPSPSSAPATAAPRCLGDHASALVMARTARPISDRIEMIRPSWYDRPNTEPSNARSPG
jgi:hypothetical protein